MDFSTIDYAQHDLDIPTGAPVWIDLVTDDVERGTSFYGEIFGWTANDTPPEFEGYKYFTKNGKAVGGCMRNQAEFNAPNAWSIFLKTEDAEDTASRAKENGGEVLMAPMKVSENGTFTIIRDCGGAVVSAWQPGKEKGIGLLNEPGAPAHFELFTRDYDKTVEFYRNVFGWNPHTLADENDFRYTGFGPAESPRAGIMDTTAFLPEGVPAHWSVYFNVENVDATIEAATRLGAKVVQSAEDTPYGRLASVADPTGAVFKLQG